MKRKLIILLLTVFFIQTKLYSQWIDKNLDEFFSVSFSTEPEIVDTIQTESYAAYGLFGTQIVSILNVEKVNVKPEIGSYKELDKFYNGFVSGLRNKGMTILDTNFIWLNDIKGVQVEYETLVDSYNKFETKFFYLKGKGYNFTYSYNEFDKDSILVEKEKFLNSISLSDSVDKSLQIDGKTDAFRIGEAFGSVFFFALVVFLIVWIIKRLRK